MQKLRTLTLAASCVAALGIAGTAQAATVTVTMYRATANGPGEKLGTIAFKDSAIGMRIKPSLLGLKEGLHALRVDSYPSCAAKKKGGRMVPALAAGGVATLGKTATNKGYPGKLPGLYVGYEGYAYQRTVAANLKTADLTGHAIVIQARASKYFTPPKPHHGEIRIACGMVKG